MNRVVERMRMSAQAQDVVLALAVAFLQLQGTLRTSQETEFDHRALTEFGNLGYGLLALTGLVLMVRRRWPVPVFGTTAVASLVYFAAGFPDGPGWLGLFVATYTLTAYGDGRRSLRIAAGGIAVLAVGWLVTADLEPAIAGWLLFRIGTSVLAAALGESVRTRRVIAVEAQERADRAERSRDEEARRRVDAERLRIAREVHDTVAHAIAIINVQAGVTAHVLDKRPERARETLVTIEQTSAQALREMRAILGVLRDSADTDAASAGLDQLDELAATARVAGLDIAIERGGPDGELPGAVDRAAYRILQESITNVIRHAGPAKVTIRLHCFEDELRIDVTDDGPARSGQAFADARIAGTDPAPGRGIAGMRERCVLLGGELSAGPRTQGGFEVRARLPIRPAASVSPAEMVSG